MSYSLNSVMGFGKYKLKSIADVLVRDPAYLKWAISESEAFRRASFDPVVEAFFGILMKEGSVSKGMVAHQMEKLGYDSFYSDKGIKRDISDYVDPVMLANEMAIELKSEAEKRMKAEEAEKAQQAAELAAKKASENSSWGIW